MTCVSIAEGPNEPLTRFLLQGKNDGGRKRGTGYRVPQLTSGEIPKVLGCDLEQKFPFNPMVRSADFTPALIPAANTTRLLQTGVVNVACGVLYRTNMICDLKMAFALSIQILNRNL